MKLKHIHKYFRTQHKGSKTSIFRCGIENCSHFVYEALIIGRFSICWRCRGVFTITRKTLRNKKFHCDDCTLGRETKKVEMMADDLLSLFYVEEIEETEKEKEKEMKDKKIPDDYSSLFSLLKEKTEEIEETEKEIEDESINSI